MSTITPLGNAPATWVAVHGFTQRAEMFEELAGLVGQGLLGAALPGHDDELDGPVDTDAAVERIVTALTTVASRLGRPSVLLGYSAGGRMAMEAALARPDLVRSLIVVASGVGVDGEEERAARRASDERLARLLDLHGLERFVDGWVNFPMFAGLGQRDQAWRDADKAMRLKNTAAGLAASLRGFGQGVQPYLGDRVARLTMPVTVIAGSEDGKYYDEGTRLAGLIPNGELIVLDGVGHAIIAEAPDAVADVVRRHLEDAARTT